MYRNIDEDERLLTMARRYWDDEDSLTETQYLGAKNGGYSQEIDNAIIDYWSIHIQQHSSSLLRFTNYFNNSDGNLSYLC